jgi:ABC-2 type transport system permease protein
VVPTPAAILQLFLPLLGILCGFAAVAGDREDGILRLVLSAGVAPVRLGIGKLLGSATVLIVLVAPTALGIAVAAQFAGAPLSSAVQMAAAYTCYAFLFVLAAVAVSARAATSQSALTILLSIWLVVCVLLPRFGADAATHLAPVPGFAKFWQQVADDQASGVDGHDSQNERTAQLQAQVLARYGVNRVEDLPVNFRGLALQAGEEYGNQVFDRRYQQLWDVYERQETIQAAVGLASPLLALRMVSQSLAGTDMGEYSRFQNASEAFRRGLVGRLNGELASVRPGQSATRDSGFWRRFQEFQYQPRTGLSGPHASLLILWLTATALGAILALRGVRP